MQSSKERIKVSNVSKSFQSGEDRVQPLCSVSFEVASSSFTAIVGKSGTGKSTLLNLIAGLEPPDSGDIYLDKTNISSLNQNEISDLRLSKIGIVFQFFNFLPSMSLAQNIQVPAHLLRTSRAEILAKTEELAEKVGISHLLKKHPHQVSGGEMQRAAIARALINSPSCILADEPTGNLDPSNSAGVINLLKDLVIEQGAALIVVTHDDQVVSKADRILELSDGRLVE
jgi:ABC-type lipoprotein export system ATPase subunit